MYLDTPDTVRKSSFMRKIPVSPQEFVETWANCVSVEEVAEMLGMSEGAVRSRVARYRKAGVTIPPMRFPVDAEELNEILDKAYGES
jgi:hypothetical protein